MDTSWFYAQQRVQRVDPTGRVSPISALTWDAYGELLWVGNETGRVTSYHDKGLQQYTSFKANKNMPIRQIRVTESGVLSLSQTTLHMRDRRGLVRFNLSNEEIKDVCCMTRSTRAKDEFFVAGSQDEVLIVNTARGTVTRSVSIPRVSNISVMRTTPTYVACGSLLGDVSFLDPRTEPLAVKWSVRAHMAKLHDFDIVDNYLVTCGLSQRQHHFIPDPPKVYDIRMGLQEVSSIPYLNDAMFVNRSLTEPSVCLLTSESGQFMTCNVSNIAHHIYDSPPMFQAPANITAVDFSSSSQSIAFADKEGAVHHYANCSDFVVNFDSKVLDRLDRVLPYGSKIPDDDPLSSVGMPYYTETLLSAWRPNHVYQVGQPTPEIDKDILENMRMTDVGGYAPNPKTTRRNQVQRPKKLTQKKDMPKFRSEQERELLQSNNGILISDDEFSHSGRRSSSVGDLHLSDPTGTTMPKYYQQVEIQYSKFGVDDFDFEHYNTTEYGGLETHIQNSYCNSFLQMLYFVLPLRKISRSHINTDCPEKNCLMCELGFLFSMLNDSKGRNCQATNFLRAFGTIPQASALGLFDEKPDANFSYSALIQNFARFIMERLYKEVKGPLAGELGSSETSKCGTLMQTLFGLQTTTLSQCNVCSHEIVRQSDTFVTDLIYQDKTPGKSFENVLKSSMHRESHAKIRCQNCRKDQPSTIRKQSNGLPGVMLINSGVSRAEDATVWRQSGPQKTADLLQPNANESKDAKTQWLPERFGVRLDGSDVIIKTLPSDEDIPSEFLGPKETCAIYELSSTILQIQADEGAPHLVAQIRVPQSTPTTNADTVTNGKKQPSWYIFNDFLVKRIKKEEVVSFEGPWKTPSVLLYTRVDLDQLMDLDVLPNTVDYSLLFKDLTIASKPPLTPSHKVLTQGEMPGPGTIVAIDAEFVVLNPEESEFRSDGTKSLIRPSTLTLARVSVLRGDGDQEMIPFIDDYIATNEPVVDYLTKYSGIQPGDLDPKTTRHTLVPLKVAYKKLRMLVDLGCKFVGHGLNKDFRIINILVPQDQVIDTVDIYYNRDRRRKISLQFLAFHLLHQDIQSDEGHDSIEDARTALILYKKYLEFRSDGTFGQVLQDVYEAGQKNQWLKTPKETLSQTGSPVTKENRGFFHPSK